MVIFTSPYLNLSSLSYAWSLMESYQDIFIGHRSIAIMTTEHYIYVYEYVSCRNKLMVGTISQEQYESENVLNNVHTMASQVGVCYIQCFMVSCAALTFVIMHNNKLISNKPFILQLYRKVICLQSCLTSTLSYLYFSLLYFSYVNMFWSENGDFGLNQCET